MIDAKTARSFLQLPSLAVIGASADERKFGNAIYRRLRDTGRQVVAVNPGETTVAGDPCYATVADVPAPVDGAIVMTSAPQAAEAVRSCLDAGVRNIWLFKGIGGPGSLSGEALRRCDQQGANVVAGACPLMFLEPVGTVHRLHRSIRRLKGDVASAR
jgi:predicted CoA-binding protein